MRSLYAVMALCLLATACTETTGKLVSSNDASQFTPGVSTVNDVEAKLGPPSQARTNSDGTTSLEYDYTHLQTNAATYIPIVGAFAGQTNVNQSTTIFLFAADNTLKSYSTSIGGNAEKATGVQ